MSYQPFPEGVTLGASLVHGVAVCAETTFEKGHEFGITHVKHADFEDGYVRTPLGGLLQHADDPTCELYADGEYVRLRCIRRIGSCMELTIKQETDNKQKEELVLDPNMKLGKYFELWEATASSTAARLGISNQPDAEQLANLERTVQTLMDLIREEFGAIRVTSGLRVPELNAAISGSSSTSYHCFGLAFDFSPYASVPLSKIVDWVIKSDLPYDQIIYEYDSWIHIGAAKDGRAPRKQALMKFSNEGYKTYDPDDPRVV
tara:strand:- start:35 stop:817 length:783 start_codon:yes stop_codon:yes gene_type:complete